MELYCIVISAIMIRRKQLKKQLRLVMKDAFEAGKRPRFHHGKLYIDGALHQA